MPFTTDKQTQDDLNLFGRHGTDAIYHLFQRCSTRGGAALLEEMFRNPLSTAAAINQRSSRFRLFAESGMAFPFNTALFDPAETYLGNTDERTRLADRVASAGSRLGKLVGNDIETQQLYQGIEALVQLLKEARRFIDTLRAAPATTGYEAEVAAITAILQQPELAVVFETGNKLPASAMGSLDTLLRFGHWDSLLQLLRHLYLLDVYIAVAQVARERGFCFAEALPEKGGMLSLEGVFHPQLKKAVPNTLHMDGNSNLVFLTGANMAGKSTFMKSVCIALYLAHMGFPVAAAGMRFSVLDGMYTTINLPDNLGMGASHFYAEVLRVKKMAQELQQQKKLFIVFDELFRGTNVKDACEATIAVVAGFAAKRNSLFIISTHIMEAGEVLQQRCPNIQFVYLPTGMQDNKPVYTYTVTTGISDDRHGMVIIQNERILDILHNGNKKLI
ncbi:MutS domain III [Filimonas lacunae]|uniref:MutS domain III n=1 Tax=Filimonas lacunae TaxID=477680 RepID=A0A173MH49_9BACT|nr:DNA mismatch repair protein [Filimonas lacunae]BAV06944.1 MutS-related protein, family 1 [Filimonas lacunae]SIS97424.1 MutS domain III [Filimonas lacunae]